MVKVFHLKHISPAAVLDQVHRAGVIGYMFSWGYTIDDKAKIITFNLRYGGGSDPEQEKQALQELETFVKSLDAE